MPYSVATIERPTTGSSANDVVAMESISRHSERFVLHANVDRRAAGRLTIELQRDAGTFVNAHAQSIGLQVLDVREPQMEVPEDA